MRSEGPMARAVTVRAAGSPAIAGFTLLEMLVVMVIAGMLMATIVPDFGPAIARAKLYSSVRDIASALRHTRGQALINGKEAVFELDIDRHSYRLTGRPKTYSLPPEIKLSLYTSASETVDEGTGRIRFFADGSATGGRVTLRGGGQTRVVDINWLTGEVKQGEGDGDDE